MPEATLTRQERKRRAAARKRDREIASRNMTPAEKAAVRRQHRERIAGALAMLESEDGMSRFLESRELNPHLTPLAAALAAHDAPGRFVAPLKNARVTWAKMGYRVRKGEQACCYATMAPAFWPLPMFSAEQTDAPLADILGPECADDGIPEAPPSFVAAAVESLRQVFAAQGRKTTALMAWIESEGM